MILTEPGSYLQSRHLANSEPVPTPFWLWSRPVGEPPAVEYNII